MNNKESKKGFWARLFASEKNHSSESTDTNETSHCDTAPNDKIKEVIVLGPGCAKCKETYKVVERVISENSLDIKLTKIEDIVEIMNYNIMTTPAVVVDGKVKIKGHIPIADEVKEILGI